LLLYCCMLTYFLMPVLPAHPRRQGRQVEKGGSAAAFSPSFLASSAPWRFASPLDFPQ
jgi:hypothetical protein